MIIVCDIDDTLLPLFSCFRSNPLKHMLNEEEYRKIFPKYWNSLRQISLKYFRLESWISFISFYIKFHIKKGIQHIHIISKVAPTFELFQRFMLLFNTEFQSAQVSFMNEDLFYDKLNILDPTNLIWIDDSPTRIGIALEYDVRNILIVRQPWNKRLIIDSPLTPITQREYITDAKALARDLENYIANLMREV